MFLKLQLLYMFVIQTFIEKEISEKGLTSNVIFKQYKK